MSATEVYQQVKHLLAEHVPSSQMDESTLRRLTLLVVGMIHGRSASPARVASALHVLGLSQAKVESLERQIRRAENDPELSAAMCFHPFARQRLLAGGMKQLYLIIDPTLQEDRVVMLSIAVWYRGRALPLVWAVWPANTPLEGDGFWQRVANLLEQVKGLLPAGVPVIWLADRAFGTPAFIDYLSQAGWHYVIRVQGQTRYQDQTGRVASLQSLVRPGQRAKLRGAVFKKAGWRANSVVVHWGAAHASPLCLVSDLPPEWSVLALYRRRYPIEASFRDYKSFGWCWEQGQVTDLAHLERLLVGMALATWIALLVGAQVAAEILDQYQHTPRRTCPYPGKRSLFHLGLERLQLWFLSTASVRLPQHLPHWEAPNWCVQLRSTVARNFVFA